MSEIGEYSIVVGVVGVVGVGVASLLLKICGHFPVLCYLVV